MKIHQKIPPTKTKKVSIREYLLRINLHRMIKSERKRQGNSLIKAEKS
jgi:hypothetical protein